MKREFQRRSLKVSLALHGLVLVLMAALPLVLRACNARKPNEKLMFVEFTVSVPPPPAPETPEPPKPAEPPAPDTGPVRHPAAAVLVVAMLADPDGSLWRRGAGLASWGAW